MWLQKWTDFLVDSFYITSMELECDLILLFGWIAKYVTSKFCIPSENSQLPSKHDSMEKADKY
jgi:hypothetical protein